MIYLNKKFPLLEYFPAKYITWSRNSLHIVQKSLVGPILSFSKSLSSQLSRGWGEGGTGGLAEAQEIKGFWCIQHQHFSQTRLNSASCRNSTGCNNLKTNEIRWLLWFLSAKITFGAFSTVPRHSQWNRKRYRVSLKKGTFLVFFLFQF